MSKAGKFVKKHPWETAGMAAAAAIGGPAALSMLGGGTAASGVAGAGAGLFGASDATAALAGDAFLPAALGAGGGGEVSMGSLLGSKFASGGMPGMGKNIVRGAVGAQKLGLLGQQPTAPPPMQANPYAQQGPIAPTVLPSLAQAPGQPTLEELLRRLQQGGMA